LLHDLTGLFSNVILRCAFFGWLIAQLLKVPIYYIMDNKLDWRRALSSGGMPSSHSAAICAATMSIGLIEGFHTSIFGLAFVISIVVMYDASGVRRAAGQHAVILNEIVDVMRAEVELTEDRLKEWIGHTPLEVFVGAWLGVITGIVVTLVSVRPPA